MPIGWIGPPQQRRLGGGGRWQYHDITPDGVPDVFVMLGECKRETCVAAVDVGWVRCGEATNKRNFQTARRLPALE